MDQLIQAHDEAKQVLQNELNENIKSIEALKAEFENEKSTLEKQYLDKIALLESEYEQERGNHDQDVTEKMQKEIETTKLAWQEEHEKVVAKLVSEHKASIEALKSELTAAYKDIEEVCCKILSLRVIVVTFI